ncbi:MAG: VWA domain-containing protein [Planctomycetota bacterium]
MILAYPWLLALLPLPLLVRTAVPPYKTPTASLRVPQWALVVEASGSQPTRGASIHRRSTWQVACFVVVWCLLVVALARPQSLEPPITRESPTRDLMLAIDLSGSMETQDFQNDAGKRITRLEAVQEVLDDFLTSRQGDRVGMIVFGSGAFVQIPFTQDINVCKQLVHETSVRMAGPKTALGDAIGLSITVFERSELDDKVLIVLTDGNDTGSRVPPAEAAKIAHDQGIVIHTIGVGDPEAAGEDAMDEEALRSVAEETGGTYFFAADRDELESVYGQLDSMSQRTIESVSFRPKRDRYAEVIAMALGVSVSYFITVGLVRARSLRSRRTHPSLEPSIDDPPIELSR